MAIYHPYKEFAVGVMRPEKRSYFSCISLPRRYRSRSFFLANGPEALPCAFLYLLLTVFDVIPGHSGSFR